MPFSKLSVLGLLCLSPASVDANVESLRILSKKENYAEALLYPVMGGNNPNIRTNKNESPQERRLQSYCTLGDIETDLAKDFGFYSRAEENATGVSCDTSFSDTCITTIITILDETNTTNTSSVEIESPCSTCVFSYPQLCLPVGQCDPTGDECLERQAVANIGSNQFDAAVFVQRPSSEVDAGNVLLERCVQSETPEYCREIECDVVSGCLDEDGMNTNETSTVEVCREVGHTDSFATLEFQQADLLGTRYSCRAENRKRTFTSTYTLGVTNFRETSLTLGEKQGEGDVEGVFDTCEFAIDGVECSSCEICGEDENGLLDIDCTNILVNATTSCDSFLDVVLYGIDVEQKFMVLQEGATPPTPSPTTSPTRSPTERFSSFSAAPTVSTAAASLVATLVGSLLS